MNVKEIIRQYLVEHRFTGLRSDFSDWEACGCELDDLMPCENGVDRCEPGYVVKREEFRDDDPEEWKDGSYVVMSEAGYRERKARIEKE